MGSLGPDQPHGGAGSVAPGKPPAFPVAEAIVSGLGSTEAPRIEAVIENGAVSTSDVRRASTATSHTRERVGHRAAERRGVGAPRDRRVVVDKGRIGVDTHAVRVEAQEAHLTRSGSATGLHVDLQSRSVGRHRERWQRDTGRAEGRHEVEAAVGSVQPARVQRSRSLDAIGWASRELGWLTTSPDEKTARPLIEALLAAR